MNTEGLIRGLRNSWRYATIAGVGQIFSDPSSFKASDQFKEIARSSESSYENVYLCGLQNSQYNILLNDYSFLQFAWDIPDLRYAYYPNPFLGASTQAVSELSELQEYVGEGVIDMDEFLLKVAEIRYSQHPPLLRYENAPSEYTSHIHPCSHLHFGHHPENRWAVRRVLTPEAFTLIVLRYFYHHAWIEAKQIKVGEEFLSFDAIMERAKLDCRVLPNELFSPSEAKQFYFG